MRTAKEFHIASWAMIRDEDLKTARRAGSISKTARRAAEACQTARWAEMKLRPSEGLMDSEESSIQQGVLMKMGSVDLIVCQGSSRSIPYCQVGRDEQMNLISQRS
jgi:hypothetical protein